MTPNLTKKQELFESRSVPRAILNLAIPSVIGQIILVIYNMADTLYLGMTGNDAMVTAAAVCMPAYMFLSAISNLFGVGGASVISRALGARDRERAKHTSSFAVWGCLLVAMVYSVGAFLVLDTFVDLLGGSNSAVHGYACQYMIVVVVLGGIITAMNTLFAHLIRAEGYSLQSSVGIAIGGILNIGLDPLFMFGILEPGNEVLGAAIATTLSNLVVLIYFAAVIIIKRKSFCLNVKPSAKILQNSIPLDVLRVGLPACVMTLCENISYAILDNLMVAAGLAAQTGLGVAKKVNMLAHSIVRGMTQGVLPLIGYNFASGNRKRMKHVVFLSGGISILVSLLCMTTSLVWSEELIGIFIRNSGSVHFGAIFLQILCVGAPFSACAYTIISFFQATGCGGKSLVLALLRKGILDIPLMFLMQYLLPVFGIVCATPIADILCCITAVLLFAIFLKKHGNDRIVKPTAASCEAVGLCEATK